MLKMDTKEYSLFTNTKQIHHNGDYGCSKCCDTRHDLTNPQRKSFQFIRSNQHILELAGIDKKLTHAPLSKSDSCLTFSQWKTKGLGYTPPPNLNNLHLKCVADPHYIVTSDMYHAAKNLSQQLFVTIVKLQEYSPDECYAFFSNLKDFTRINYTEAKITDEDYKGSPNFMNNTSLESAPMILVKFMIDC